jgi:hypothetical protein
MRKTLKGKQGFKQVSRHARLGLHSSGIDPYGIRAEGGWVKYGQRHPIGEKEKIPE